MEATWQKQASNILKAEITRRGVTYDQLQEKLSLLGIEETSNSVNIKINRGSFSFAFFLQVMKAIGAKTLRLDED